MTAIRVFIAVVFSLLLCSNVKADVQECIAGADCPLIFAPSDKTDSNTPITNLSEATADFYYFWNDTGTTGTLLSESAPDNVNVFQIGTTGNYKVVIPSGANIVTSANAGKTLCVYISGYTNITTNRPACVYVKTKTDENTVARIPSTGTVSTLTVNNVWDEAQSGHTTAGTFGYNLDARVSQVGGGSDPWLTALPGTYGSGTAGKIVGDNLNATVGSRSAPGTAQAIDMAQALPGTPTANTVGQALKDADTNLDAAVTSRASGTDYTTARAAKLDNLDAAVTTRQPSGNVTVGSYAAGQGPADLVLATPANKIATDASGAVTAGTINDKTGYALSTAGIDAILDDTVDGVRTLRQVLCAIAATQLGKSSGMGTTTVTFRNIADTANVVVGTMDSNYNRTAVTLTLTGCN